MAQYFDLYIDTTTSTIANADFSKGVYFGRVPFTCGEINTENTVSSMQDAVRELTGINVTTGRLQVINGDGSLTTNGATFFDNISLAGDRDVFPTPTVTDFTRFNNLAQYASGLTMRFDIEIPQTGLLYATYANSELYAVATITNYVINQNTGAVVLNKKSDNTNILTSNLAGTITGSYYLPTGWIKPTIGLGMPFIMKAAGVPYGMAYIGVSSPSFIGSDAVEVNFEYNSGTIILDNSPLYSFYTEAPSAESDPYDPAGNSGTGGGQGNFDLSSDSVDFPALPTLTAVDTGLVSVYTPTLAQLKSLANFLWNANVTDVDWWKKLVANPLDLILGLSIVPVAVPAGVTKNIEVGLVDTGVSVTKAASQFVEVDCGSIMVKEYWGSALDYSPFRRFSIYLPFIGTRTISTDDIMGKNVHVKYHIDLLSGACTAMVKCGDAVLYQYSGACAVSLPLTGETFTNVITSTIQLAASIGATVATGGAAAGVTAASAANSLMSMKPIVERAGGVSGAAGQLGVMTPYLIGEIPKQSKPENANKYIGYPSNITAKLGELTGFTSVDIIHMENIPATNAEKSELESILKAGVLL